MQKEIIGTIEVCDRGWLVFRDQKTGTIVAGFKRMTSVLFTHGALFVSYLRPVAMDLRPSIDAVIRDAADGATIDHLLALIAIERELMELSGTTRSRDKNYRAKVKSAYNARRRGSQSYASRRKGR